MTLYHWSRTAANNGTADVTCPFPEGMGAPALNDGTRGMMAAVAKHRDDIAGAIVTGGTLNAYTVSSFQVFDNLADMSGQVIAFTPHATNGATVTLNVDGLGAKPLRAAPATELLAGVLVLGSPYLALYNNADGAFYLQGMFGNPYNIPLAGGLDYWGSAAPNSAFAFPIGQAISRATYAALYALVGNTYGAGDGATTFNLPDKRGRVSAAIDLTGTRLTGSTITGGGGATGLGGFGGGETKALVQANLPNVTFPVTDPGHTHGAPSLLASNGAALGTGNSRVETVGPGADFTLLVNGWSMPTATTGISVASGGSGTGLAVVQPTIMCNYIMRIL